VDTLPGKQVLLVKIPFLDKIELTGVELKRNLNKIEKLKNPDL
jgi:hypothetical protein